MNNALGDCAVTYGLINDTSRCSDMCSDQLFYLLNGCFEHLTHRCPRMSRTTFPGYAQRPIAQGEME